MICIQEEKKRKKMEEEQKRKEDRERKRKEQEERIKNMRTPNFVITKHSDGERPQVTQQNCYYLCIQKESFYKFDVVVHVY